MAMVDPRVYQGKCYTKRDGGLDVRRSIYVPIYPRQHTAVLMRKISRHCCGYSFAEANSHLVCSRRSRRPAPVMRVRF